MLRNSSAPLRRKGIRFVAVAIVRMRRTTPPHLPNRHRFQAYTARSHRLENEEPCLHAAIIARLRSP
jgi:hypothetical protein